MNDPLVSAIIPVYNGERFLALALESVFAQQYPSLEVIVVDDGSLDGSARIAQSFAGVRYLYQPNQGVAVARNAGIAASRGEFIAFLDQDDMWTPDKLRVQIGRLTKQPDIGYALSRMRVIHEPGIKKEPPWLSKDSFDEDQAGHIPGTMTVRRSAFELVGLFDSRYEIASDLDWLARARYEEVPAAILPDTLLLYRVHEDNQSHRIEVMRTEMMAVLKAAAKRRSNGRRA